MPLQQSSSPLPAETDGTLTLIPGLPNDVGGHILYVLPTPITAASNPPVHRGISFCLLKPCSPSAVSTTAFLTSYASSRRIRTSTLPFLFDPENLAWRSFPQMPCNPYEYGLCNFTSLSVDPHIYVLGGSLFNTRSFPLDRPSSSSSAFRYNFLTSHWDRLAPMLSPRGSFTCAALPGTDQIIVPGGGSRHTMFRAAGSRICSVEKYDVERNEWVAMNGLLRFRAGCVGFTAKGVTEEEFWVMGGYEESRTVSGVFPMDEYCRDAVVMDLKEDGRGNWRVIGNMWEEGG